MNPELVDKVARSLVEPLGYTKQAAENWGGIWVGSVTDTPETGSLEYLCRSLATAALEASGIVQAREALEALVAAVDALPVEEWVEADRQGDPELLGYCMQAQGEWDRVKAAKETARQALSALDKKG